MQGIGAGLIFGNSAALITSVFPGKERGRALGYSTATIYFSNSIGPYIGGILTGNLGWRSIFVLGVLIGLLAFILVLTNIKGEWVEANGEKFDYKGSLIYGLVLIFLIFGLSQLPDLPGYLLILLGIVIILVFVRYELKVEYPVLNLKLFTNNKVFFFSALAALPGHQRDPHVAFAHVTIESR